MSEAVTFSGGRHAVKSGWPRKSAQMADFGADAPKFNGQPIRKRAPISRRCNRARLRLTHLLVVPIEDYREKRGGQNIEDNDIDVRMPFDQGEH